MINIEIEKSGNESNAGTIRRFSKRMQESGILQRLRKIRYQKRARSRNSQKKFILKAIGRREEVERLLKLGKTVKTKKGRRR